MSAKYPCGTRAARDAGCSCDPCKQARLDYFAAYRQANRDHLRRYHRAYSGNQPLRDAASARALVATLLDLGAPHVSWIARQTGISRDAIDQLLKGRRTHVRSESFDAIASLHRRVAAGDLHPPGYAEAERKRQERVRRAAYRSVAA